MTPIKTGPIEWEFSEGFSSISATFHNGETPYYEGVVKDCHLVVANFKVTPTDNNYIIDMSNVSGWQSGVSMMLINMFMDDIKQYM